MEIGLNDRGRDIEIYGQQITLKDKNKFLSRKENQMPLKAECSQKDASVTEEISKALVKKSLTNSHSLEKSIGRSNPYSNNTYIRAIERLRDCQPPYYFTLLEDLTHSYDHPCVLDLKMGTRLYGDDATEERIQFHKAQSEMTTSCRLGVRIGGMQVSDKSDIFTRKII